MNLTFSIAIWALGYVKLVDKNNDYYGMINVISSQQLNAIRIGFWAMCTFVRYIEWKEDLKIKRSLYMVACAVGKTCVCVYVCVCVCVCARVCNTRSLAVCQMKSFSMGLLRTGDDY